MSDNKAIKIPTHHYVGFQKRTADGLPLGFMTPEGTDKAAEKRKATVDSWASGSGYGSAKQATLPAKVLENKPLSGFNFGVLKRGGGSGWDSRSDAWRVQDPRGFELEIGSGNVEQIMSVCTIEKGEILNECIWARLGNVNILVPVEHDLYKAATVNTERMGKSVSIKDLSVGNRMVFKNGDEAVYLGRLFVVGIQTRHEVKYKQGYNGYESTRWVKMDEPVIDYFNDGKFVHVYQMLDKQQKPHKIIQFKVSSLPIAEVHEFEDLTIEQAADRVNEMLNKGHSVDIPKKWGRVGTWGSGTEVLAVSPKPITDFVLKKSVEPIGVGFDETEAYLIDFKEQKPEESYTKYVLVKYNDEYGVADFRLPWRALGVYPAHYKTLAGKPIFPITVDKEAGYHYSMYQVDPDLLAAHNVTRPIRETYSEGGFYNRTAERDKQVHWPDMKEDEGEFFKIFYRYTTFSGADMCLDATQT